MANGQPSPLFARRLPIRPARTGVAVQYYPNLLTSTLAPPNILPPFFQPSLPLNVPQRKKPTTADMFVVAYSPTTPVLLRFTPPPRFRNAPARKRAVTVFAYPNITILLPPPPPSFPVGQGTFVSAPPRKRPVVEGDTNLPNLILRGIPPGLVFPFVQSLSVTFFHRKKVVRDVNILFPNLILRGIPTPPPPVVGSASRTRPGGRIIMDSKRVNEILPSAFDFISRLGDGETIVSATALISVYSGIDLSPQSMLASAPTFSGSLVTVPLKGGVLGVIYTVLVEITTNLGYRSDILAYLAVRP